MSYSRTVRCSQQRLGWETRTFARGSNPPACGQIVNLPSVAAPFCPRGKIVQTYKKKFVELAKQAALHPRAVPICRGSANKICHERGSRACRTIRTVGLEAGADGDAGKLCAGLAATPRKSDFVASQVSHN